MINMLGWVGKLGRAIRLGRFGWVAWQCKLGWATRLPQVPTSHCNFFFENKIVKII
jgi:hypothetical protein